MNKKIKLFTLALTTVMTMGVATPAFADSNKIVSLGHDLTEDQKSAVLTSMNVKKEECQVIDVTNADERNALLGIVPELQIGTKTLSCAYVEPAEKGTGIKIEANNLTWVSESMLRNALVTAGINDAVVKANAPYPVSGTGALTGIMKGYEKATGETLSDDKKEAANQELVATGQLADNNKNLTQESASALVNDIKKEVIEEKPKNDKQIGQIVNNVTNNYETKLSDEDKQMLVTVMSKINSIDYNNKEMSKTLDEMSDTMKEQLKQTGVIIKEMGILDKIYAKLCEIGNSISSFFNKIKGANITVDGVTYDTNGNIVTKTNPFIKGEDKSVEEVRKEAEEKSKISSETDVTDAQNKLEDELDSENKVDSSNADKVYDSQGKVVESKDSNN